MGGRIRACGARGISRILILLSMLSLLVAACGPSGTTPSHPTPTTTASVSSGTQAPANMQFEAAATAPGTFNAAGLTEAGIQGVDVEIRWSWLEPDAPVNGVHHYNWSPFDSEIAQWHNAGKRVMLLVHYIGGSGSCSSAQMMPDWEITRIPHVCGSYGEIIPDYFDPTFVSDLETFVRAIGNHYAQSPSKNALAYVRIATGVGGEETAVKGDWRDWSTFEQVTQWGYTPYTWRDWVEARLTTYQHAFPWTIVLNAVNVIVTSANNCSPAGPCTFRDPNRDPTTGQTGLTIQAEIAYWAADHGLGIGQQGLAPGYTYANIPGITAYIRAHWSKTFIEFQTNMAENDPSSVQGNIRTAYCYGGKTIEWYANVATNPAYQRVFQDWNQLASGQTKPPSGYCTGL
jgi:hypothetical protein